MSLTDLNQRLEAVARELAAIRDSLRRHRKECGWQNPEEQVHCEWQGLSMAEREQRS